MKSPDAIGPAYAALFGESWMLDQVYRETHRTEIATLTRLYPHLIDLHNFNDHLSVLSKTEVIFTTWTMPALTEAHLEAMPRLKILFYAAGTVKEFSAPLFKRGVTVVSGWMANAIPVAEFSVAQILLSTKGYWRDNREYRTPDYFPGSRSPGNYGETVSLLGAGAIGRAVIRLLKDFRLNILVYDPFLSPEEAVNLGVEKVALSDAFERGYVVSNHLADVPQTKGLLKESLFRAMRQGATFINTGRGATVDEAGLVTVLSSRPDVTALLDVTFPEPPVEGSKLYSLNNIRISSHIAGSIGDEVQRLADYCLEEFKRWRDGEPLRYIVSESTFSKMT